MHNFSLGVDLWSDKGINGWVRVVFSFVLVNVPGERPGVRGVAGSDAAGGQPDGAAPPSAAV